MLAFNAISSWTLKSIAGVALVTIGAIGAHSSSAEASRGSDHGVASSDCRGDHEDREHGDRGHDDRGDDDKGHDHRGRGRGRGNRDHDNPAASDTGLQQIISVRVPATAFLRVDKAGKVTAAATNTGCQPSKQDDVFVFGPDGTIKPTAFDVEACHWRGDFSVPGRFQSQDCRADQHGHGNEDSHRGQGK